MDLFGCSEPAKAEKEDIKGIINFVHASSTGKGSGQKTKGGASYGEQTRAAKEHAAEVAKLDGDNKAREKVVASYDEQTIAAKELAAARASYDEQTRAAKKLAAAVAKLDGDNFTPRNGKKVKGLTNLTKDVECNGSFGSLTWSFDSKNLRPT